MIMKYSQGSKVGYDIVKWLVDEETEIASIPRCAMGSIAYVITTGKSWMMSSKGVWYPMCSAEGTPIECDCVEESTIWENLSEK